MTTWYCWDCEEVSYEEDLGRHIEIMDPGVSGSAITWLVCGCCRSDQVEEITYHAFRTVLDDVIEKLQQLENADLNGWGASARYLDRAFEQLYE